MKNKISYLNISDIHLGHNINPTENIIKNLKDYFDTNDDLFKKLDMIIITGDIFDKLLASNSTEYLLVNQWLTELVLYCVKYDIMLRILEGTPGHDWKQAKLIYNIINKIKIDIDFKYVDTLYVEENTKLGINILYIPDEYKSDASLTLKEVKELMLSKKIDKFDLIFMHGQFNYQLPMVKLKSSHDEKEYMSIVNYYINIGHIHTMNVMNSILPPGSFDRLAHNEEEPKGGLYVTIYSNGDKEFFFIENKNAMIFKTYEYDTLDVDTIVKDLDSKIKRFPERSNIRILVKSDDTVIKSLRAFKERYPLFNIKIEVKKTKDRNNILPDDTETVLTKDVQITSDNILELLEERLTKYEFSNIEHNIFKEELSKVI